MHTFFAVESLFRRFSKHGFPKIRLVIEDCANRGSVPIKGLPPVFAVVKIGIVLIEIRLRIKDFLLLEEFGHPHISNPFREHVKDMADNFGGQRINY
jgi:hypothetical protein